MSSTTLSPAVWTAVELATQFGAVSMDRVRTNPPPGLATELDVVAIHDQENRLCELQDGSLLEKTMGSYESYLAALLCRVLVEFVESRNLGVVLGADGMLRLSRGLVRIPDVSFISWERLPGKVFPREEIWPVVPDFVVEIISHGNTQEEMTRKLDDYFSSGVRLVWYIYPESGEVHIYQSADVFTVRSARDELDGDGVLPGFRIAVSSLFGPSGENR
jgi:Uma2 family endonuclease